MVTPPEAPHSVVVHYAEGGVYPKMTGSLSADDFRRLLDAYGDRMYPAERWIDYATRAPDLLYERCCVSFDDGLRECLDVFLPVLEERDLTAWWGIITSPLVGVPLSMERFRATREREGFYQAWRAEAIAERPIARPDEKDRRWYLNVPRDYLADRAYLSDEDRAFRYWRDVLASPAQYEGVIERIGTPTLGTDHWLSADDIRALRARGHVIGAHSHSHPMRMTALSREQQAIEYATSKHILERILGEPVTTLAHPCGVVTDYGVEWMKANGITLAWGATMDGSLPYNVPRWSVGNWR